MMYNNRMRGFALLPIIGIIAVAMLVVGAVNFFAPPEEVILEKEIPAETVIEKTTLTPSPTLGAGSQNAVGGKIYSLSGGGISSSQTTINITNFDIAGGTQDLRMSDFGTLGCATIEPGHPTRQEFISFTGVTQNSDDTAQLTGVTRGLQPISPYTASTTLQYAHSGSSFLVLSNSPPCFYEGYANLTASSTISAPWIYKVYPEIANGVGTATTTRQFTTKGYVDGIANQGAATSTLTNGGILERSTALEAASSTDGGVDIPRALTSDIASGGCTVANNRVLVTNTAGRIEQNCIATTTPYDFSGVNVLHNTTTATSSIFKVKDTGTSTPLFLVDGKGNVNVGTSSNSTKFDLAISGTTTTDNLIIPNSTRGSGKLLTSNNTGVAVWQNPSALGTIWGLENASTTTHTAPTTQSTILTMYGYTIPGGSIGANGFAKLTAHGLSQGAGATDTLTISFGGSNIDAIDITSCGSWTLEVIITNQNSVSAQSSLVNTGCSTTANSKSTGDADTTINTAANQTIKIQITRNDANDVFTVESAILEIMKRN